MNKKLCITTYVFGDKYKNYIPLFIYSIKKNYPEYGVVVFCKGNLSNSIKKQLEKIQVLGDFKIVENKFDDVNHDVPRGASLRWLLWDEKFIEYDSIYIADIDIFYCKEDIGIYEQHKQHSKLINKPFSNIVRRIEYKNIGIIKRFLRDIKWCGVNFAWNNYKQKKLEWKLTGLHFHDCLHYKENILPLHNQLIKKIENRNEYIYGHSGGFNDESFLYDIIKSCNLSKDIPVVTNNKTMLQNSYKQKEFRPHHGIHLGVFRSESQINSNTDILSLNIYKKYASLFKENYNDEVYKYIEFHFCDELKNEINLFKKYYEI